MIMKTSDNRSRSRKKTNKVGLGTKTIQGGKATKDSIQPQGKWNQRQH